MLTIEVPCGPLAIWTPVTSEPDRHAIQAARRWATTYGAARICTADGKPLATIAGQAEAIAGQGRTR